jgi:hypothetical protein
MNISDRRIALILAAFALILSSLACNALQVGVVTPTSDEGIHQVNEENESPQATATEEASEENPVEETPEAGPVALTAVAWYGHIASMPDGSQYDDVLLLTPEGTGEFGLEGSTPEIEAEIRTLRDGEGPQEYVHLWGEFSCGAEDVNGCQLLVDRLQYGAQMSEEEINNWVGFIQGFQFNMGSTFGFILDSQVPMKYGIHASQDLALQAEIESLRDTGALVQISGTLLVGFPDVNSSRIEISALEILEEGSQTQPTIESFDPTADWLVYTNTRYNYKIKYPEQAELSFYGPEGFLMEDLPEGMTPDEYLDALLKEYTDKLCVMIEYGLGYIYISAPPNNQGNLMVHCGVGGGGSGEYIPQTRELTIDGILYIASGHQYVASDDYNDGTLNSNNLGMRVDLEDGVRIFYGGNPRTDATFLDFVMKTQETLEQIISTYQSLD